MRRTPSLKPAVMYTRRLSRLAVACVVAVMAVACGAKSPPATTAAAPPSAQAASPPAPPAPAKPAPAPAPAAAAPVTATPSATKPPAPAPLLGRVTESDLRAYEPWAALFATPYVPDAAATDVIKTHLGDVTVFSIVATWCPDSRRELPRFFAIMKAAGLPASALTMVGVDRSKKDTEGLTEKWGITRVPTFVFLRGGQEIGRVVERTPQGTTLEAEIARILSGGAGR